MTEYSGYIQSPSSSGVSDNPFYTFTVADKSEIYAQVGIDNPSLPFCRAMYRASINNAILAIAPQDKDNSDASSEASNLRDYFVSYCGNSYSDTIRYFESEDSLEDYVTDKDYEDDDYQYGKVAYGIVLIKTDIDSAQWEYKIRVNYTGILDQDDPTVACLYSGCDFTYTIPSTKFYTLDLYKPQQSIFLYGYTYTAFSTLQLEVDRYILSQTVSRRRRKLLKETPQTSEVSTQDIPDSLINIYASMSVMSTEDYKSDDFQFVISSTLGIFYMLSFLYPVSRIIRALVLEKECRIKEGMKMMGLTDTIYG